MEPEDMLACWEHRWGTLSEAKRAAFLERPELEALRGHSDDRVRHAIGVYKRLRHAVDYLENGVSSAPLPSGGSRFSRSPTGHDDTSGRWGPSGNTAPLPQGIRSGLKYSDDL